MPVSDLKSVEKAFDLLRLFQGNAPSLDVRTACSVLSLPRSTVYRLLKTLQKKRVVAREGAGKYVLGPWFNGLAIGGSGMAGLRARALPVMRQMREDIGETVILSLRSGSHVIYFEKVESEHALRAEPDRGRAVPLHAGASGKAILAFLPRPEIEKILGETLQKIGPHTITDPQRLRTELEKIRRRGYATSCEEVYAGIKAVSIPIRDARGSVVGALTVEGPEQRMPPSRTVRVVKLLRSRAKEVSALFDGVAG